MYGLLLAVCLILWISGCPMIWAFMAGAASQAGDADSSRAPGLTSGMQGSMNVHRGALLSTVVLYCWCHSDSESVPLYFYKMSNIKVLSLDLLIRSFQLTK